MQAGLRGTSGLIRLLPHIRPVLAGARRRKRGGYMLTGAKRRVRRGKGLFSTIGRFALPIVESLGLGKRKRRTRLGRTRLGITRMHGGSRYGG